MSKSRRHSSIIGITTTSSEKKDKRIANKRLRRLCKVALQKDKEILPHIKEISDIWQFGKDGKLWFDKNKYPRYMRK